MADYERVFSLATPEPQVHAQAKIPNPTTIYLEISKNCDLKCIMCQHSKDPQFIDSSNPRYFISVDLFKTIAEELFPTAKTVGLTGFGESTLHPKFMDLIDITSNFDCRFGIVTNLSSAKKEIWDALCENGFDIIVSFDGASKETFERQRVGSDFNRIMEKLRYIQNKNQRLGNTDKVKLLMAVSTINFHEMAEVTKIAYDVGVNFVNFIFVQAPIKIEYSIQRVEKNSLDKEISRMQAIAKKLGIKTKLINKPLYDSTREDSVYTKRYCPKPWTSVFIDSAGKIGPCNHHLFPLEVIVEKNGSPDLLGDLKNESFENIWNGEKYKKFRARTGSGNPIDPVCINCYKDRQIEC